MRVHLLQIYNNEVIDSETVKLNSDLNVPHVLRNIRTIRRNLTVVCGSLRDGCYDIIDLGNLQDDIVDALEDATSDPDHGSYEIAECYELIRLINAEVFNGIFIE